MKKLILSVFIFTVGFATATHAQQVNTLLTKQLPEAPGNYAPGAVDTIHRHDAHAVVYVLEREVEMQVRVGMLQRVGPGQVFYESPEDVHNIASLCNGRTKRKWDAMLNLESGDRIELFYEDSLEATIRATVNRLLSDRDEGMGLV